MTEKNSSEPKGRRRKRKRSYVQIENAMFEDPRMTGNAKGILGYLLTKPDGWVVRVKDIANHFKNGESSIKSGLKELRHNGYLMYYRTKKPDGTWGGTIWEYDDLPFFDFASTKPQIINVPFDDSEDEEIPINDPQVENQLMDETLDMTEVDPQVDFPPADNPPADKRQADNHPYISNKDSNKTYSNKTTTTKTKKDLVSISSSSDEILKIDKTFQEIYKDAPLEEIKAKLFEDAENRKVKMKTEAQYFALMAKRIQFYLDALSNTPTMPETSQFGEFATGLGQIPLEQRSHEFKAFLSRTSEVPNSEPSSKPSSEIANGSKPTSEKLRSSSSESLETQLAVLTQPEKTPEEIAEAKKEIQRLMDEIRNEKK